MDVIVPDDQLSLAIGRKGQNVRLAAQLTGWRIDINSESKMREVARWLAEAVSVVPGCGEPEAELLLQRGITSLEDLARCESELLPRCRASTRRARSASSSAPRELAKVKAEEEARAAAEAAAADAAAQQAAPTGPARDKRDSAARESARRGDGWQASGRTRSRKSSASIATSSSSARASSASI